MDQETELEELTGTIESVIYSNEENGYAVLKIKDENGQMQTLVGCIPMPASGESIICYGQWLQHPDYGKQFKAELSNRILPNTAEGIYDYLASGIIKGLGPATALLIVNEFGDKSLSMIDEHPEELAKINGISLAKAKQFSERYKQISVLRRLIEFLCSYNIRTVLAIRLYKYYGSDSFDMINENPYILATNHIGGKFEEADVLALNLGLSADSNERIKAALIFELRYNTGNGHCFIPRAMLISATAQLIGVPDDLIENAIEDLILNGELIQETLNGTTACYLPDMYLAETEIAEQIAMRCGEVEGKLPDLNSIIHQIESVNDIRYTVTQKDILKLALENQMLVITGGPGTGKTTSIKALIELFDCIGCKYMLAAPTGRAAKRMSEVTHKDASTIHRLLGAKYSDDGEKIVFSKNEDDKLDCGVLILDECSMIDLPIMHALLKATKFDCRLIFVGDVDQLPPVGPGNCFKAFIDSGKIETVRLTSIFRQSENSAIIRNAHMVNNGEYPDFGKNDGDFFRLKRLEAGTSVETVAELCAKRLPDKMKIMPEEIQVLSPTRKGGTGTIALNKKLQEVLNPQSADKPEKSYGDSIFRLGDRVMQVRNNYDIIWHDSDDKISGTGIFNGDIGYITRMDPINESLTINFDGRIAEYGYELLSELEHAWAITVHKSQGCEFKAVVFVLSNSSRNLLTRGILYTGITRAKNLLILVGDDNTAYKMVDNAKQSKRFSFLKLRIKSLCGVE